MKKLFSCGLRPVNKTKVEIQNNEQENPDNQLSKSVWLTIDGDQSR